MAHPSYKNSEMTDSASQVRAFAQTFAMTQWLSKEELDAYQAGRLSKLLLHARKTTDFYKSLLDVDPTSPASIKKTWSNIPILTRAEAIQHRVKITSRKV